jgi:hypothetical protein
MRKFNSLQDKKLMETLPFSYHSVAPYLDYIAYTFNRNGESLLVWQDILCPNEFPCIFMPNNQENWVNASIALATTENIEALQRDGIKILLKKSMGCEFFYNTKDFINPKGNLKNRIKKFSSSYDYSITNICSKERILEFYDFWKTQRDHTSLTFKEDEEFFNFCIDNFEKYDIKQVYVESENKIIGLAWGVNFPNSNNWVGLHLKVNYAYKGLSRFLYHERAKLFENSEEFTLGTQAHDKGIEEYKEDLNPIRKKEYYLIITGDKIIENK